MVNGGMVMNLKLQKVAVDVPTSEMAAAAVGMLTGEGTVSGVEVLSGHVAAARGNGAIVGRMIKGGTISGCKNYATVTGTGANVGGIVGAAYYTADGQTMTIENCYNYGTVTGTAGVVGGIAGLSAANVSNCVNESAITGKGNRTTERRQREELYEPGRDSQQYRIVRYGRHRGLDTLQRCD